MNEPGEGALRILANVTARLAREEVLAGIFAFARDVAALTVLFSLFDVVFPISQPYRSTTVIVLSTVVVSIAIIRWAYLRYKSSHGVSYCATAAAIERAIPGLDNAAIHAAQFAAQYSGTNVGAAVPMEAKKPSRYRFRLLFPETSHATAAPALRVVSGSSFTGTEKSQIDRELTRADLVLAEVHNLSSIHAPHFYPNCKAMAASVVTLASLVILFSRVTRFEAPRILHLFADLPPFTLTDFTITPAYSELAPGGDVLVAVTVGGFPPKTMELRSGERGRMSSVALNPQEDGVFSVTLRGLSHDTIFYAVADTGESPRCYIHITSNPSHNLQAPQDNGALSPKASALPSSLNDVSAALSSVQRLFAEQSKSVKQLTWVGKRSSTVRGKPSRAAATSNSSPLDKARNPLSDGQLGLADRAARTASLLASASSLKNSIDEKAVADLVALSQELNLVSTEMRSAGTESRPFSRLFCAKSALDRLRKILHGVERARALAAIKRAENRVAMEQARGKLHQGIETQRAIMKEAQAEWAPAPPHATQAGQSPQKIGRDGGLAKREEENRNALTSALLLLASKSSGGASGDNGKSQSAARSAAGQALKEMWVAQLQLGHGDTTGGARSAEKSLNALELLEQLACGGVATTRTTPDESGRGPRLSAGRDGTSGAQSPPATDSQGEPVHKSGSGHADGSSAAPLFGSDHRSDGPAVAVRKGERSGNGYTVSPPPLASSSSSVDGGGASGGAHAMNGGSPTGRYPQEYRGLVRDYFRSVASGK